MFLLSGACLFRLCCQFSCGMVVHIIDFSVEDLKEKNFLFLFFFFLLNYLTYIPEFKKSVPDNPCSWIGKLTILRMAACPQIDLQIQCHPYQNKIPAAICRNLQSDSEFIWKCKRTENGQSSPKKEEQSWRTQLFWFQNLPQSCSGQDGMALTWRWAHKSLKPSYLLSVGFQQRC